MSIQQEQTLGTLDLKIDAMMERRTQAIMDRLDGLLGSKSWPRDGESNSVGPCREPRVNFKDQQNRRRTYGSTRGRGSSSGYATGDNRTWGPNIRGSSTRNRHTSNERSTQGTHATGRGVSRSRSHASPGRSNASQGRNNPSDSDGREVPNIQPLSGGNDTPAGPSRDATSMATAFEPLNRSLETFLALSGVKACKASLLSEAEARRKEKPQKLATKKMQELTEETCEPEPVTAVDDFKIDYRAAARDALNRAQQEMVTKEIEQKVKLELENEKLQEKLNAFESSEVKKTKVPSSLSMKLNVISGQRFDMVPKGSKIQSIISVAGHQVIRNLSEPSELTLMHLGTYADYLRQVEPRTESRAVRALLTTGGPRIKKLHARYLVVYGPYQVMLNVDGISIYTRTFVTTDSDQMGQIYLGEEELKVRRIGHDVMMEQDAVHIGYEADVTAICSTPTEIKSESQGFWTQER